MIATPIKTHSITTVDASILDVLDRYVPKLEEKTVVAITSKIISICEGSVAPVGGEKSKEALVEQEADYFLPKDFNTYGFHFTIKNNTMISSAGIDQSNGHGNHILWPRDPQKSANEIREYLSKKWGLKSLGVVIVDSKTVPLRRGTVGTTLAHSGFLAINDYRGTKDLFDYTMRVSQANVAEGLGATAVMMMGEGTESTPIVLMYEIANVVFQDRNPSKQELADISISLEEDLYAPILQAAPWKKGTLPNKK